MMFLLFLLCGLSSSVSVRYFEMVLDVFGLFPSLGWFMFFVLDYLCFFQLLKNIIGL